jgi:hypothetical protein
MRLLATFGFGMALASCLGPIEPTPNHCFNQDGNDFCAEKYGDERKFCGVCDFDIKDGCTAERPPEASCYSPCGDAKTLEEDPACEGVAEGSSSSDSVSSVESTVDPTGDPTTEPTGTMTMTGAETESETVTVTATDSGPTTGGACVTSDECTDPMNPICEDMECVPCTDAPVPDDACAEKGAGTPVCRDDGACVACTPANAGACDGTTPVCDGATNQCEGCNFHEQCPDSACRIETGACFDEAEVYDVGSGQTYPNLSAAVADLGEGGEVVLRIHDGPDYNEAVAIAGAGTAYALLADDDAMVPQWVNTGGDAPTLTVEDGAEVYVQSLRFTANTGGAFPGIRADGATLYLDRTQVVGNTGGGILLANAANGYVRNCFVGGAVNQPALEVQGGKAFVLYSTVAGSFGNSRALTCGVAGDAEVRNSILVSQDDAAEYSCQGGEVTDSATEAAVAGAGNVSVGDVDDSGWFAGYDSGNFDLLPAGLAVFADIAQWAAGDPLVDIDGDARPTEAGPDVAGADIP